MQITYTARYSQNQKQYLTLFLSSVQAGFPSPAEDYEDKKLDLNNLLIQHPEATYFCRVSGDSMQEKGIRDGDLLVVDRAQKALNGSIVIVSVYGEITCKILDTKHKQLLSANPSYPPIPINEDGITLEGVVIHSICSHVRPS